MARLYEIAEDCVRKTSFFRNFSPSDLDTKTATNKFVEYNFIVFRFQYYLQLGFLKVVKFNF